MVGLFVMPSSTIFRQHTRLNAATNKTTKKISHTRRSPKDRNYPSTPFDKLPFIQEISSLIYNSSMYFDTGAIYLGSPLMEAAPKIFDQVLAKVHQLSQNKIDLVRLPNSDKATLLGACSVITHYVLKLRDYQLTFLEEKSNFTT
ncbi:hypothetical protein ACFIVJ_09055 [Oenococcus oeni]|uniref:hypothetical protein n=1 Tax=Oenococcus oeni TaxID=1247 RepID=UPI003EE690BC